MSTIDAFLDQLADRVADRIVAKMGGATKVVYTTSKRGPHAPGKSRAWMLRMVRTMPGARKVGRDWCIDASDFERWATARDAASFRAPAKRVPTDVDELAALYLAEAGFRSTKGKRVA